MSLSLSDSYLIWTCRDPNLVSRSNESRWLHSSGSSQLLVFHIIHAETLVFTPVMALGSKCTEDKVIVALKACYPLFVEEIV